MTDSTEKNGHEVISETSYDLITFDAVPDPGFKCARLSKVESAMRPMDSMTLAELQSASNSLKSSKMPAFESRIRMIDKEIERRKSIDITSEVQTLRKTLESVKKAYSMSKVEDAEELIELSRSFIKESRSKLEYYDRSFREMNEEMERLKSENDALRDQISRLDEQLYQRSLSPDYLFQLDHLQSLIKRVENLQTNRESIKESRTSKEFSNRYCAKESRIKRLLSNTNEGSVCGRDSQKIAQFERESETILNTQDQFEEVEDSLTRTISAQIRR
jgi:hypothetical protein